MTAPCPTPRSSSRRPGGRHLAAGEDHDLVADPLDLLQQVGREHDVDAELGPDATDQGQHRLALGGVEAVGRLVEQHQQRVVGDRRGQLDPLPLTGREGADRPQALLAQPDLPQDVRGAVDGLLAGQTVDLRQVADEVVGGHVAGEVVVLGGVADALPDLGPDLAGVEAEDAQRAGVGPVEAEDHADEAWSCRRRSRRAGR